MAKSLHQLGPDKWSHNHDHRFDDMLDRYSNRHRNGYNVKLLGIQKLKYLTTIIHDNQMEFFRTVSFTSKTRPR